MVDAFDRLHQSLDARPTPEYVASLISEALGNRLLPAQHRLLTRAAGSRAARYSSMSDDFDRPVGAEHKVRMMFQLLGRDEPDDHIKRLARDPWLLVAQVKFLVGFAGWMPGTLPDPDTPRLNRAARERIGVDMSARRYRRVVRQLRRTHRQALKLQEQVLLRQMLLMARSGLAYTITVEEMRADPHAAAFVAYWTAQRNRRRAFTLAGRDNPMDQIAEALLARCELLGDVTDWWMIARVYPVPWVLARLTDAQRGKLVGLWFSWMRLTADRMRTLAQAWGDRVDYTTMVVARGVDSSTWNAVAGAYNQARASWMNVVTTLGAWPLLEQMCPGKAMRLMAGDLTSWHAANGTAGDPQVAVWAALPHPWRVLDGIVPCGIAMVAEACRHAGVDPEASGWTGARWCQGKAPAGPVAAWRPTPELVHGVEVGDPILAGLMRREGVFSGKPTGAGRAPAGLTAAYLNAAADGAAP